MLSTSVGMRRVICLHQFGSTGANCQFGTCLYSRWNGSINIQIKSSCGNEGIQSIYNPFISTSNVCGMPCEFRFVNFVYSVYFVYFFKYYNRALYYLELLRQGSILNSYCFGRQL